VSFYKSNEQEKKVGTGTQGPLDAVVRIFGLKTGGSRMFEQGKEQKTVFIKRRGLA